MRKTRGAVSNETTIDALRQHLFDIEPELGMLEGVVAILQSLSTTADHIEPLALAPLAHLSAEALEKVWASWRQAMAACSKKARAQ
ncbi:hypothetical protein FJ420_11750 [Mesorhizobium sp. B3-1-3]|uniref:hypothetical protein n=1 Tax=unclassified Mesorhizobium TaxID=325217 RepID=UPI00112B3BB7|nr:MULTISPECIES: hypothetical protein [unclassified Mesorhizobium]TPI65544.1 hypothetical protein FJ424_16190 [Mesorhizobium sp. B3-1-8]TPI72739.1 hypothetical protein FJ420_11750 [Mesorhizobium sp. B3-1-3]